MAGIPPGSKTRATPMMDQKIEYIHNNPVARGYAAEPTHWLSSSARNYAGMSAPLEIATDWLF